VKETVILQNYLAEHGCKITGQRRRILEAFLATEEHVSAEELYRKLKENEGSGIGLATVYRTLKLLCASGLARELQLTDGVIRYEHHFDHEHHDHLVCLNCGRYIEVSDPQIEALQEQLAQRNRFRILHHRMELYGICGQCQET
jgi:Fur family transcriptional regulator, ferric uptake regulator